MADGSVLRLFVFAPAGVSRVLDARLREATASLGSCPGLNALHLGRRGAELTERALVTVWESEAAMEAARGELEALESELQPGTVETLAVEVEVLDDRDEAEAVLRVFRGAVRDGALEEYVDRARQGTVADIAGGTGPLALYLATLPPERFVTVSLWSAWDRIMTATGGNVGRPVATRHSDYLIRGQVAHYEVIPSPVGGRLRRPSAVD